MPRSWASGQLDTKMLGEHGSAGTKKLSGHPSWTSGNLGDWTRPEKGHGVASRLKESRLRIRHCRRELSGRPQPKASKARSAASAHRSPPTEGQVITEVGGEGVGWIWGPA